MSKENKSDVEKVGISDVNKSDIEIKKDIDTEVNRVEIEKDIDIEDFIENMTKKVEINYEGIREYLKKHRIEGIVFHRGNGEMCKIKRSDFGFTWKNEKRRG